MSKWRRPATKTYDYNYRLGEHYYKPQLSYLETRKGRGKTPPPAKTFAERFAEDPIYGHGTYASRRAPSLGPTDRFASMDDLNIGSGSAATRARDLFSPSSPRLVVGDRLLDSVGIAEGKLSQPLALSSSLFSSEGQDSMSTSARRKVGFTSSAAADLVSEDPFKSSSSGSKLAAARKQADEMMEDMKKESEASVSRFRARAAARKEERREMMTSSGASNFGDEDDEMGAIRLKINKIGERAKARIAQLDEDFPDMQITSSLANRRAAANATFASSFGDDEDFGSSSKALKVSKRTVRASYELE